jgi:hypothetical protein
MYTFIKEPVCDTDDSRQPTTDSGIFRLHAAHACAGGVIRKYRINMIIKVIKFNWGILLFKSHFGILSQKWIIVSTYLERIFADSGRLNGLMLDDFTCEREDTWALTINLSLLSSPHILFQTEWFTAHLQMGNITRFWLLMRANVGKLRNLLHKRLCTFLPEHPAFLVFSETNSRTNCAQIDCFNQVEDLKRWSSSFK